MKRSLLALVSVLALTMAGSLLAQTDNQPYGSTGPSATTSEASVQPGAPDSTSGSTSDPSGVKPQPENPTTDPATAPASDHQALPKTASNQPLLLLMGLSALGGTMALRARRLRRAR
jgi:LPXTG-motif cell wall-anchored protein